MVREFKFKGFTPEQLQSLSIENLLPLLNSRAAQIAWIKRLVRTYMNDDKRKLREKLKLARDGKLKGQLRTHTRDMIILPDMVEFLLFMFITAKTLHRLTSGQK